MRSKVTTTRHVTAMPPQGIRNRPHSSSIEKGETVHVHFRESPMESKRRSPILILEKSQTGAHRRHISIPPQTPSYFLKGCRKGGGGEEELGLMTSESQGIEMEKMAVGSIHVYRDIGTQMTPPGSSGTSACPTPRPLAMPSGAVLRLDYARKDGLHTAPMRTPPHPSELGDTFCGRQEKLTKNCDTRKPKRGATLMRPSEEEKEEDRKVQKEEDEEEEDIRHCPRRSRENHNNKNNKSSHHDHDHDHNNNDNSEGVEKTTFKETFRAWEEAERARCIARSEREEARIQAWEEQKKSQALEKLKKLQIKVKKMQQKGEEKTTRKIMAAERQARQMRAATKAREAVALDKAKHHFMHSMKHQEQEQEQPQPQPQQQRFSYCCCPWPHRKSLP